MAQRWSAESERGGDEIKVADDAISRSVSVWVTTAVRLDAPDPHTAGHLGFYLTKELF